MARPEIERACSRDDECAVAEIATSGEHECCPACATTPGTRRWFAKLKRYCGSRSTAACLPLACPLGPTRAVCRAGQCEATTTGADGKPAFVIDETRCLPVITCDQWAGCATVTGNAQDGRFVYDGERVASGEIAGMSDNECTSGARCPAARVTPPGVTCPGHTTLVFIAAPPFTCAPDQQGRCRSHGQPAPSRGKGGP